MNEKNLLLVVVGLAAVMLFFVAGNGFVIDKITDKVIEKLQKEYSPSPYGPGLDPDVLDYSKMAK